MNYLLLVKSLFPFYYILAKSCPKNFPTQCQMFSNHIIQDEEKCYITDFRKVSLRTLFFLQDFFSFQNTFLSNKTTNYDCFTSRFFSDQWAYISCVTIFYYLYCMVQEVYIGSPYDQYAASTILLPKWTILANIPVCAEKRDEIGHIQIPNALPFSWSA